MSAQEGGLGPVPSEGVQLDAEGNPVVPHEAPVELDAEGNPVVPKPTHDSEGNPAGPGLGSGAEIGEGGRGG